MKNRSKLNIAGRLASVFIESKLTMLLIAASFLFGAVALFFTPRTYNPEIVVPVVNISVNRPGSDTHEILQQIVKPLEALMASSNSVLHLFMACSIDISFKTGFSKTVS